MDKKRREIIENAIRTDSEAVLFLLGLDLCIPEQDRAAFGLAQDLLSSAINLRKLEEPECRPAQ